MGADYTKEYNSTWEEEDVKKWKEKALNTIRTYYLSFAGTQWHEFDRSTDTTLLRAKICYAIFGPPTEDADNIESAYTEEQKKKAETILNVIFKVHEESLVKPLRIGFIIISCKQEENEFVLPLFSVYVGKDADDKDRRSFVDTQCRIYKNWEDWKTNNTLPMLKYAYPKHGFFTCSGNSDYKFDESCDPDVEYGNSPQCKVSSRIFRQTDNASALVSLAAGGIGVIACFTPLAPIVLTGAAIGGTSSAVYGATRVVNRLVDKGTHGQSLGDLESITLWISLAATPLHFAASTVNGTLAFGAQQGRTMSNSMRMFATVLNFTTLGVDAVMLTFGLTNLIQKAIKEELTALDVLQFSMSAFFFTNTLMQPKTANSVIKKAQEMHIDRFSSSMTDDAAKSAFKNFLDQNTGQGTNNDRAKIIRTINRMENPEKFFKGVGPDANVKIGGRKGRTVLLTDTNGNADRINPNKFNAMYQNLGDAAPAGQFSFNSDFNKLARCYEKDPNEVELGGERIFADMNEMQKRRIGKVFGGSARKYNKNIVKTSHDIAEFMGCTTVDELMSIIEIVAAEVKGKEGVSLENSLSFLNGTGKQTFVDNINNDIRRATTLAQGAGLSFRDPLYAVYHFRKHGIEFPDAINRFGNRIETYLGEVRNDIFQQSNLKEVCRLQDGVVRKIYVNSDDHFGVITSTPDGQKISTMFQSPGKSNLYLEKLSQYFNGIGSGHPEPVRDVAARLARCLGFRDFHVSVTINGSTTPIEKCPNLDQTVHHHIAHLLSALAI